MDRRRHKRRTAYGEPATALGAPRRPPLHPKNTDVRKAKGVGEPKSAQLRSREIGAASSCVGMSDSLHIPSEKVEPMD